MRKFLFALLLTLGLPFIASAQTVVSGHVRGVGGAVITSANSNAFVRFRLRNFAGNVARLGGTGVCANGATGLVPLDIHPDTNGAFSQNICGNDVITPANTFYSVEYWFNGQPVTQYNFIISGGSQNLDTATPINSSTVGSPLSSLSVLSLVVSCVTSPPAVTPASGFGTYYESCIDKNPYFIDETGRFFALGGTTSGLGNTNTWTGPNTFSQFLTTSLGISSDGSHVELVPATTSTLMDLASNQTVTGTKTGVPLSSPTSTGTDNGTETLQNKTISGGTFTGTISGSPTFSGTPAMTGGYSGIGKCVGVDTSDAITNATTSYTATGLACTLTSRGGDVIVIATGVASATTADGHFALRQDSSTPANDTAHFENTIPFGVGRLPYTVIQKFTTTPGSHTFGLMCLADTTGIVNCGHGGAVGYYNGVITAVEVSQ